MKQLIHLNQKGKTNSTTPYAGVAQLSGLQAIDSLPNEVGYDSQVTIDWHFSVANNEFYSAESSNHKIYRTLDTPSAHYHTSVDVACNGVSGTNETTVVNSIWGKFERLGIMSADGHAMTYWGGNDPPQHLAGLVSQHDGSCIAWSEFFVDVLDVHSISSNMKRIAPTNPFQFYEYTAIPFMIIIKDTFSAQNNNCPPHCCYNIHAIVLYNDELYDPSYGNKYGTLYEWESSCVDKYAVHLWYGSKYYRDDELSDPKDTQECDFAQ